VQLRAGTFARLDTWAGLAGAPVLTRFASWTREKASLEAYINLQQAIGRHDTFDGFPFLQIFA
jgi:hypothetical protein